MTYFFAQWLATAIALWASSFIFSGISFQSTSALLFSALCLGFANAIFKPILIALTLPLTFFTFGFFLLVINALVLLLISSIIKGFTINSFGTAFFASIFISIISLFVNSALIGDFVFTSYSFTNNGTWI